MGVLNCGVMYNVPGLCTSFILSDFTPLKNWVSLQECLFGATHPNPGPGIPSYLDGWVHFFFPMNVILISQRVFVVRFLRLFSLLFCGLFVCLFMLLWFWWEVFCLRCFSSFVIFLFIFFSLFWPDCMSWIKYMSSVSSAPPSVHGVVTSDTFSVPCNWMQLVALDTAYVGSGHSALLRLLLFTPSRQPAQWWESGIDHHLLAPLTQQTK